MNWCKPHWAQLRAAVDARGLTQFVAADGAEAARRMVEAGAPFEPLLGSWMRINEKMATSPACRGRILQCPLCILVEDGQPHLVANWIDGVTDDALRYAVEQGLVKRQ